MSLLLSVGCENPGALVSGQDPAQFDEPQPLEGLSNQAEMRGSENSELKERCDLLQKEVNHLKFINKKSEEQVEILKLAAIERDYNKKKVEELTKTITELHEKLRIRQDMIKDLNKQLQAK